MELLRAETALRGQTSRGRVRSTAYFNDTLRCPFRFVMERSEDHRDNCSVTEKENKKKQRITARLN